MKRIAAAAGVAAFVAAAAGCGGGSTGGGSSSAANPNGKEVSPAGDIPDNQAFVRYAPPRAGYTVEVPEGWARTTHSRSASFTDNLNSVTLESAKASRA